MKAEDGPGAAMASEKAGKNCNGQKTVFHKLSTGTPVIVSIRSGRLPDKVKWYHEAICSRLCKKAGAFFRNGKACDKIEGRSMSAQDSAE